ncbi:MAG: hypothetical protein LBV79_05810 [Candidatus Adiutrix sp.]|jgi:DNA-binding response OmpR family regulator|nr:hypothetical protein [Candidatus Adiutrix sp.]
MKVVIVGRDLDTLKPLVDKLTGAGFEVVVVDSGSGVQSYIKSASLHFLLADANLLMDRNLGREVLNRCPLARLIVLASQPSLLGMIDALSGGLTDYFPRFPEYFDEVVDTIVNESRRLSRWQEVLLSGRSLPAGVGEAAEPESAGADDDETTEEGV